MPIARRASARATTFGRSSATPLRAALAGIAIAGLSFAAILVPGASGASSTSVSVSSADGRVVDPRGFPTAADAYLTSGGCATPGGPATATTLPDGDFTFLVETADGATPLSSDAADQRAIHVTNGLITATTGNHATHPRACPTDPSTGGPITVALAPFGVLPVGSTAYRVLVAATAAVQACAASGDATGFGCPTIAARSTTFTVGGATPSTATASVSSGAVALGDAVVDQVSVSGTGGVATGTAVFYVCSAASCETGGAFAGSVDLAAGRATSPGYVAATPGTFTFRVEYWGDATYTASWDSDVHQTFVVSSPAGSDVASVSPSSSAGATPSGSPGSSAPVATASASVSAAASSGPSASPSSAATAAPSHTPAPTAARTPRPTPIAGPTKTPPPPPPYVNTPPPTPTLVPVNLGPGGCASVCYLVSPTFFGPGWGSAHPSGAGAGATRGPGNGTPNPSALQAYGPGGVPHFPGLNAPSAPPTPPAAGRGIGGPVGGAPAGSAAASGPPGASGAGASGDLIVGQGGSPIAAEPSNVLALGAGASDVSGGGAAPPEVAGTLGAPDGSAAGAVGAGAGAGQATPTASDGQPSRSATTVAVIALAILLVGGVAAGWVVRHRRTAVLRSSGRSH